ncbi:pterin-4-alpha-carbinolamine dehydratase [Dethiosulfatibacter aminovorans DSM 17477]|uniref:Putative pterin-4-alpha-carbinolamine dehydratase n=1 Tax=Dethiosulfatibacter aminovorans DSM 17477 TaxID=1121476 RepID=A0A1M6JPR2_9FIRM|nr:4a-hydroxytetrahydrobiopterin dehydratase [Dethiosulfatibacter aminovorans]SHJ48650.1 pterin-4-alpha-carbinolamine dehydratase [Dethiosulfatibacter aminovorans DSM 17477]
MTELTAKSCVPCSLGTPTLEEKEINEYIKNLSEAWEVIEYKRIERKFKFNDFKEALDFTVKVGELAELEGHHPDIMLSWGKVVVTLTTHKIGGLSENDFILAAKIDRL